MEACSGAHEWARRFLAHGHDVLLIAPAFVAAYRKGGKNDGNDAEAICEAVSRPSMRFVPLKTLEQQAMLTLHRVREGFVEERVAVISRIRGLLAEFGEVLPQKAITVRREVPELLERLPARAAGAIRSLRAHAAPRGAGEGLRSAAQGARARERTGPAADDEARDRSVDRVRHRGDRRQRERV
jgi:transposase